MNSSGFIPETTSLRQPKATNTNGFMKGFSESASISNNDTDLALRAHQQAIYFIENKGRDVPSLQEMESFLSDHTPINNPLKDIKQKIVDLREQHAQDLETLYEFQVDEYKTEIERMYVSGLELPSFIEAGMFTESEGRALEQLMSPTLTSLFADQNDLLSQLNYVHYRQLLNLQSQYFGLKTTVDALRSQEERRFPQTKEEFESKSQEMKLRVGRYLVGNDNAKEKMAETYYWPYMHVKNLVDLYKADKEFQRRISEIVKVDQPVADPRKARTQVYMGTS